MKNETNEMEVARRRKIQLEILQGKTDQQLLEETPSVDPAKVGEWRAFLSRFIQEMSEEDMEKAYSTCSSCGSVSGTLLRGKDGAVSADRPADSVR